MNCFFLSFVVLLLLAVTTHIPHKHSEHICLFKQNTDNERNEHKLNVSPTCLQQR